MRRCRIRVRGRIGEHWESWFGGLTLSYSDDETQLDGTLADQAALYGVLARLRDLSLELLSVQSDGVGDETLEVGKT
jgi:hypothetical protein